MIRFDKQTINSFSKEINHTPFENAYSKTHYIISLIMKDIMDANPYIHNYDLYIANEALTRGEIPSTTLDLFLALDAKQMELNFVENKMYKLKTNVALFSNRFFKNFKRAKKKKKKKEVENDEQQEFKKYELNEKRLKSYNVKHFNVDLLHELAKYFTDKTTLFLTNYCINIAGKEDLGVFIRIFVVFNNEDNTYSMYNLNSKSLCNVNFKERFNNNEIADIRTNGMFSIQLEIFNNMFYNVFRYNPNQILIESLLYSCPFNLFGEDVYETTMSLINYLKNTNIKNLKSICDDYELTKENLTPKNSVEILYKFINGLALL